MRIVLPVPAPAPVVVDVDRAALHALYGDGWLAEGGVRVNFVSSADGAIAVNGLSGGLQTPGDKVIFSTLRNLADVVLAGSGTVLAEQYRPVVFSAERRAIREELGLTPTLPVAVVSRSLRLDLEAPIFVETAGAARPFVLTCRSAGDAAGRARLAEVAELIDCGEDDVDLGVARRLLAERGLPRILCEGGPTLFSQLVEAGQVDELCLSFSPGLAGPGSGRITAGERWTPPGLRKLRLISLIEDDSALFFRYAVG